MGGRKFFLIVKFPLLLFLSFWCSNDLLRCQKLPIVHAPSSYTSIENRWLTDRLFEGWVTKKFFLRSKHKKRDNFSDKTLLLPLSEEKKEGGSKMIHLRFLDGETTGKSSITATQYGPPDTLSADAARVGFII